MSNDQQPADTPERFIDYLTFVSDMLGGDILPIDKQAEDLNNLISHRAIDYVLIRSIVLEIQKHNVIFHQNERIHPFPTLDALGNIRGNLLQKKGDIHQISLLDRIGELTVSYFNLTPDSLDKTQQRKTARVFPIK